MSGVIATMTVGLILGRRAKLELGTEALAGMRHLWQFLSLTANIVVFFAVGLLVDPAPLLQNMRFIPVTLLIAYLARTVSVLGTIPVVERLRLSKPISMAYQLVLVWGGLRGGLALALVLALPENFPQKKLFLALATAVVFSTLFINALTTRKVLSFLRLDQLLPLELRDLGRAAELVHGAVFDPLLTAAREGALSAQLVAEQDQKFAKSIQAFTGPVGIHRNRNPLSAQRPAAQGETLLRSSSSRELAFAGGISGAHRVGDEAACDFRKGPD